MARAGPSARAKGSGSTESWSPEYGPRRTVGDFPRFISSSPAAFRQARSQGTEEAQGTGSPQSQAQAFGSAPGSPKAQPKKSVAFTSLAELLHVATERVRSGKLAALGRSEPLDPPACARLLIFAASNYDWSTQHIELGSHEINSVYLYRSTLVLTGQERFFILRTVLLDRSLTKPGWFWTCEMKVPPQLWLPYFATEDSEDSMRQNAVVLATRTGLSLRTGSKKSGKPIFRILRDQREAVRIAGLQYLAAHGRASDLDEVERLLKDDANDVRSEAEMTARLIRLRITADAEARKSIQRSDPFDERMANALAQQIEHLQNETLNEALKHPSGALRALSARELLKRGATSEQVIKQMCNDEAKAVKECGYLAIARSGGQISPAAIRGALKDDLLNLFSTEPSWNRADPELVIGAVFDHLPPEALWKHVYAFDEDSPLALKALGRRHFKNSAALIREDLKDDFKARAAAAKSAKPAQSFVLPSLYPTFLNVEPIESIRQELTTAALEILAASPTPADRQLFLDLILNEQSKVGQTVACLRGLATVGLSVDREKLKPLLSCSERSIESAAARAYLALSPNSTVAAKDLLSEPSAQKVWIVVAVGLTSKDAKVWPVLEPLLGDENEDIRRMVSYYAVRTLTRKQLQKLLNNYFNRGRYFYNVVVLFDRALYAPAVFQAKFLEEERDHFKKWHTSAASNWTGLDVR